MLLVIDRILLILWAKRVPQLGTSLPTQVPATSLFYNRIGSALSMLVKVNPAESKWWR